MSQGQWINGQWQSASSGLVFESTDPVYQEVIWSGHEADNKQIQAATSAAHGAFDAWAALSFDERCAYVKRYGELLAENKAELAQVIACETGKPLWEATTEVGAMIGKVGISIEAYQTRTGNQVSQVAQGRLQVSHRAHGVMAVLGPFNFPGHLPGGHIIPALLAGNTLIFKPSELTPHVGEKMLDLWAQTDLPNGVLNMIQGGGDVAQTLLKQPEIKGVMFTGSAKTGCAIHAQFAGRPDVMLALEMGGNNPLLVSGIADLDAAAYMTIQSAFITAGQRCVCARRLLVPKGDEGDRFLEVLQQAISGIRVAAYDADPQPFMGSVISAKVADQLLEAQEALLRSGAQAIIKMRTLQVGTGLLMPGLLDVSAVKDRQDHEIFGPLLQVIRVKDNDAAINEANQTAYGLSAGILTDSPELAEQYRQQVRAGIINWNCPMTGASSAAPFGGPGLSGNHRPSAYYAADYCAYPVASMQQTTLALPETLTPGIRLALKV